MDLRKTVASLGLRVIENGILRPKEETAFLPPGFKGKLADTEEARLWRRQTWPRLRKQLQALELAQLAGIQAISPALYLKKIDAEGREIMLGLASLRVVTTSGVNFLVDAFQGLVEPELLRFHALGTGVTAEAVGQTALVTELTTQYNPDNTRATGTLAEGASANIYRSVGTNTVDAAAAVTEHGLMSQAATGGGTMWDRSLFSVINLANGDGLESTYDATFAAGG